MDGEVEIGVWLPSGSDQRPNMFDTHFPYLVEPEPKVPGVALTLVEGCACCMMSV